jgi:hypothetical protein
MTERGFGWGVGGAGWTNGRMTNERTEGRVRQEGQVGQARCVGGGRTESGCSSMNIARGRRSRNTRSTKLRRSLSFKLFFGGGTQIYVSYHISD